MVICIPRLSSRPMPRAAYLPPGGRRADIHPRHPPNQGEGWSLLQRRRTFPSPFAGGAFRREPKRGGMASALCDRLESKRGWGGRKGAGGAHVTHVRRRARNKVRCGLTIYFIAVVLLTGAGDALLLTTRDATWGAARMFAPALASVVARRLREGFADVSFTSPSRSRRC